MKVLVTGATGFVGGNLARALVARGYQVRALVRPGSSTLTIDGTNAEVVHGDLLDRESLARAMKGCQAVFHCAALYTFWHARPQAIYRVNVEGTRNIMEEAARAGVSRVVYTSSTTVLGMPPKGLATEETEPGPGWLKGHYRRSKYLAEQEVWRLAQQGLPVVIVNPSAPVGPWDVKPTPTGRVVLDFLRGRLPAYVNTGLNLVDVEDVAVGHILALEKGRVGQRYILGNQNVTLRQMLVALESIAGRKAPRLRVPWAVALAAAWVTYLVEGRLLRRQPSVPLEGVYHARRPVYVDCTKAVRELGFPQSPVEGALEKAVRWFRDHGYV